MKSAVTSEKSDSGKRLESLDALRGFDMLFIMGLSSLVVALCKLFPDGGNFWLAEQMYHAPWDGFLHHDTIFPLFIFMAGVSFPYSFAKSREKGLPMWKIYRKMVVRALVLFGLGLVYNGVLQFNPNRPFRIFSVLGRIGIAGLLSSVLFVNFKPAVRGAIAFVLLAAYAAISFIPSPEALPGVSPFSKEGCLAAYIDRTLFGAHIFRPGSYDPEGLLSTVGAVVTAMLGNFTGEYVRSGGHSGSRKTLTMLGAAAALLVAGLALSKFVPVNKSLWSSSYVLVVGSYSLAAFALFYWIIDVRGWRKWAFPLKVVGVNSIAIYMLQRIVGFKTIVEFFFGGIIRLCSPAVGDVVYWAAYLLLGWLILLLMYRKKIYLKV